jgi:hypothetical protein
MGGKHENGSYVSLGGKGVDWLHVDQDRHQWRALVNTVMNVRVP